MGHSEVALRARLGDVMDGTLIIASDEDDFEVEEAYLTTRTLPAWAAARGAGNLLQMVIWTQLLATSGFAIASVISLWLDQPFAPALVLVQLSLFLLLLAWQQVRSRLSGKLTGQPSDD